MGKYLLLNNFHFNGPTLGFYRQTEVRTTLYSIVNSSTGKYTLGFHPQTQKLELPCTA